MTKSKLHSKLLIATMVAGGLMMGMGPAHATVWNGTDGLAFGVPAPTSGGAFASTSASVLTWRADALPVSSLSIISPPSNTSIAIDTAAGWVNIATLQHNNQSIPGSTPFNWSGSLIDDFTLAGATFLPPIPGMGPALPQVILPITFTETSNTLACPLPNPLGSICDDFFTVTNLDSVINSFLFTGLGSLWQIDFQVMADPAAGSFFDPVAGIIYTAEGRTSVLNIQARITQVPEPGTLALLGLGLAGLPLGLARRRAAKKADAKKA